MIRAIVAALTLLLFAACKDVKEPIFEDVDNLKMGKADLSTTSLSADVRFINPNRFGMHLKKLDCSVYVDTTYMGQFTNSSEVHIPARDTFHLPITGEVQTLKLLQYSRKVFLKEPSLIRVEGNVRVGRSGLYKTIPVSFTDTILLKF